MCGNVKERKRRTSESEIDSTASRKKSRNADDSSLDASINTNHASPRKSGLVSRILDQPATIQRPVCCISHRIRRPFSNRPSIIGYHINIPLFPTLQNTPPLDVERVTQTLKEKNVQPSSSKFGFLGLGIMGSGMVKNLLNSGHKVIVWNRTSEKVPTYIHHISISLFIFISLACGNDCLRVLLY